MEDTARIILLWIGVGLLILSLALIFLQRFTFILQYAFFLRYCLMGAVVMLLLPLSACEFTGAPFRNVFVLENAIDLPIVVALALLAAWTIQYTSLLTWTSVAVRAGLYFRKEQQYAARDSRTHEWQRNSIRPWLKDWRGVTLFSLIGAPVIFSCACRAQGPPEEILIAVVIGVLGAALVPTAARCVGHRLQATRPASNIHSWLRRIVWAAHAIDTSVLRETKGYAGSGYEETPEQRFPTHRGAVLYAILTIVVYLLFAYILKPDAAAPVARYQVPPLAYVLMLILLLSWILPWFAFESDKYRVPPEVIILLGVTIVYFITGIDHYYEIRGYDCEAKSSEPKVLEAKTLAEQWTSSSNKIIAVAASGGGITAAYWTATVLTGLQETLGPEFAERLRLVSTASGGGVGAMYFVDSYQQDRVPTDLEGIRKAAGLSSLSAMMWGFLYPDLARVLLPLVPVGGDDRGWALETRWAQSFGGTNPTFEQWEGGVRAGWRPLMLFNATLVESGERFVLAPVDVIDTTQKPKDSPIPDKRTLARLYPGADIKVVTAARLSATFPWVTPVARPRLDDACGHLYHVADGGYYDNFGVLSVLEALRDILRHTPTDTRVLFLRIRASNSATIAKPLTNSGLRLEMLGPAEAMLAVRSASQLARSEMEIEMFRETGWLNGRDVQQVVFEYGDKAPLSWQLSKHERVEIDSYWSNDAKVARHLCEVACFLQPKALPDRCKNWLKTNGIVPDDSACDRVKGM